MAYQKSQNWTIFKAEVTYQKSGSRFSIPDQNLPSLKISLKSVHALGRNRVGIIIIIIIGIKKPKNNNIVFHWRRKILIIWTNTIIERSSVGTEDLNDSLLDFFINQLWEKTASNAFEFHPSYAQGLGPLVS